MHRLHETVPHVVVHRLNALDINVVNYLEEGRGKRGKGREGREEREIGEGREGGEEGKEGEGGEVDRGGKGRE